MYDKFYKVNQELNYKDVVEMTEKIPLLEGLAIKFAYHGQDQLKKI